jgi:hypothetical protein
LHFVRFVETDEWLVATSWNPVTGDLAYYRHRTFDIRILPPDGRSFLMVENSDDFPIVVVQG